MTNWLHRSKVIAATLLLSVFSLFVTASFSPDRSYALDYDLYVPPALDTTAVSDDVLWLARCIYSETKRAHEQELVAWVIRNRVETRYRGNASYEDAVLDPYQFSAFNPNSSKRGFFTTLAPGDDEDGWAQALHIAHYVYHAPDAERPFAQDARHFYSERSMRGGRAPNWAEGQRPVRLTRHHVNPRRFRFYRGIA